MNQILNEDCEKWLNGRADESIDMVLTSPPYDNMRLYKRKVMWDFDKFQRIAAELVRCIKPGGAIVWVVGDETVDYGETGTSFRQALHFMELGMTLHDTMIFEKANPMPGYRRSLYRQCFEYIFVLSKGELSVFNPILVKTASERLTTYRKDNKWSKENGKKNSGANKRPTPDYRYHNNIFRYGVGGVSVDHPAVYPIKLAIDMIYTYTDEGALVYDPFVGSGTTNLAAHSLGRSAIGTEIVEEYANYAQTRLQAALAQQTINFES